MSVRRLAPSDQQPASFAFTAENLAWAKQQIAKFPEGRQASAVIPLLWRAQEQAGGWTPSKAIEYVADLLGMPCIRVLEVATFYTMFLLQPVGRKAHVQWCGTTPCLLRGGEELKKVCQHRIHHEPFHVSADGNFSWEEVECLGACVNAPMVLIGRDTYEDLTAESLEKVLDSLARGETPTPGPQTARQFSAPFGGETTLTDVPSSGVSAEPKVQMATGVSAVATDANATLHAPAKTSRPAAGKAAPSAKSASTPAKGEAASKSATVKPPANAAAEPAKSLAAPVDGATVVPSAEQEAPDEAALAAKLAALPADATAEDRANAVGVRPRGLSAPREGARDNLQRIKGIGRINEQRLNDLGIFHFDQIAHWTRAEIRWVGTYLAFPGRIDREKWVDQAASFAVDRDKPSETPKA